MIELKKLKEKYPNDEIIPSTLSDYTREILKFNPNLPIIESEIGDSWIHGVGSAPQKISKYRRLTYGGDLKDKKLIDKLLLIPEHTWGLNILKYASDFKNYTWKKLKEAREKDHIIIEENYSKYKYLLECHGKQEDRQKYSELEKSWIEQEEPVENIINKLGEKGKKLIQITIKFLGGLIQTLVNQDLV